VATRLTCRVSLARSETPFHSAGRSRRRGEVYQNSPSPAQRRRSGYVSPIAFCLLSLSLSLLLSHLVTPFYPSLPKLRSVLRGKLLRGASLFWLPYFTDSDRPPFPPPPLFPLPFYPFSPLLPYPPFRAAPPASPESLLSLHFAPSCSPQCVTLSLIQHVVPARQRNAPRSLVIPQPSTFLPRSSSCSLFAVRFG
jgi:hypothetical protein